VVLNEKALREYTESKVQRVGRAKAGWLSLARIAGVTGLPSWISQHSSEPYLLEDYRESPDKPRITFGNLVEFVDDFAGLKILPTVFDFRIAAMKGELNALIEAQARKEFAHVR
jgi:hypothetical protein